jgi:hypothetical protein
MMLNQSIEVRSIAEPKTALERDGTEVSRRVGTLGACAACDIIVGARQRSKSVRWTGRDHGGEA